MGEEGSVIPQVLAALGATLGAFSLGTVLSWPAPSQSYIQAGADGTCKVDFDCLTKDEWSQVAALSNIGGAIVPVVALFLFPFIGKKWTMMSLVIPFIAGWVLLIFSTQPWMFYLGRLLTGFSGGAFAIAAPSYSNEIAEPRIRGALGSLMQLMICLGILFMFVAGKANWQVITGVCIIFPTLMAVSLFWFPRSPKFLIQKGDIEGARKSLQFFRKKSNVEDELSQIQEEVSDLLKIGTISPITMVTRGVYLKPFLVSLSLMAFQQFSGINFVVSYTVEIFRDAGSEIDENLSSILVGIVQVLGTGLAILIVDRFGRKLLLASSAILMCIATSLLGVFFFLKENVSDPENGSNSTLLSSSTMSPEAGVEGYISQETLKSIGILPLVSLMLYIAGFSIGFGPLPWVMNVELFSSEARVPANAACGSMNWLFSYLVVSTVPALQDATSASFLYFLFSGVCLLGAIFVIFVCPETKGKTEQEMKDHYS